MAKPKQKLRYPKVGDKIRIKRYSKDLNGKTATVIHTDGSYIYVRPRYQRYEVELIWDCEIENL